MRTCLQCECVIIPGEDEDVEFDDPISCNEIKGQMQQIVMKREGVAMEFAANTCTLFKQAVDAPVVEPEETPNAGDIPAQSVHDTPLDAANLTEAKFRVIIVRADKTTVDDGIGIHDLHARHPAVTALFAQGAMSVQWTTLDGAFRVMRYA